MIMVNTNFVSFRQLPLNLIYKSFLLWGMNHLGELIAKETSTTVSDEGMIDCEAIVFRSKKELSTLGRILLWVWLTSISLTLVSSKDFSFL